MQNLCPESNVLIVLNDEYHSSIRDCESILDLLQQAGKRLTTQFAQFGLPGIIWLTSPTTLEWTPSSEALDDKRTQVRAAALLLQVKEHSSKAITDALQASLDEITYSIAGQHA